MATFQPRPVQRFMETFGRCFMEPELLEAFGYVAPPRPVVALARGGLKARGRLLRAFPARRTPVTTADKKHLRSRPQGCPVHELGTFPTRAPGRHTPPAT